MSGAVIERVGIDLLLEHPKNPNKMSGRHFRKLVWHIKESGDYEPVVVRRHKEKEGFFEILNGHHRTKALRELGHDEVDCVVWDVSDERALMLLATLNRLKGGDDAQKRADLINELSEKYDIKELAAALPETKGAIEKLKTISVSKPVLNNEKYEIPETLVYVVTDEQKKLVERMVNEAIEPGKGANNAERKAWALVEVLRFANVGK